MSPAARHLQHPRLLGRGQRQGHRGRLQDVLVAVHCAEQVARSVSLDQTLMTARFFLSKRVLTPAPLRPLEAQLRVLVQTHSPQFGHVFGAGGHQREPITTGSRGDLAETEATQSGLQPHSRRPSNPQPHLLCRLQPIRSQLVFSGFLPAAVGNHKAGNS